MTDKKAFLSGIANKLSVLMGTAVLVASAQGSTMPISTTPIESSGASIQATGKSKSLPAKLILKQQSAGFKLVAAHGSHSSHASHASHSSHSSRAA